MDKEINIAFALLRNVLDGTMPEVGQLETRQWWSIFRLMQRHHVVALSYDAAVRCEVPREVLMPWLSEREKAIDWHRYQLKVQQDILDIMQHNGLPVRVLKGSHTAHYFPQAELREFGDLDLYFGDRHAEADKVAEREMKVTVDTTPHHHTKYDYRGVTVESHYAFFNQYYPGSNRSYNQMLDTLGETPTFDVLHYLRHAAIHFAAQRLSLRDLCDWAFIVSRGQGIEWDTVEQEVRRFGMSTFVTTLDNITHTRLGIASPLHNGDSTGAEAALEKDLFYSKMPGNAISQYLHNRWKRRLVFGDSEASLLLHKVISHLSHRKQ